MAKENREIKSTVFADLFGGDETDGRQNFLSLYRALHGGECPYTVQQVVRKRIPQAIYRTFSSDVSMIVGGTRIVLLEHQSTLNENMPLRFLEYYVHLLYGIVPHRARYRERVYRIPAPEFYVFYNGEDPAPREGTLRLSEAYLKGTGTQPQCEVAVKFLNIGTGAEALPAVQNCGILKEYCRFMEIVRKQRARLKEGSFSGKAQGCYEEAVHEALEEGILKGYLERKSTEVINMFIGEYSYADDLREHCEEAIEIGREQKSLEAARNLLKMNLGTVEQIAQAQGLPVTEVEELAAALAR